MKNTDIHPHVADEIKRCVGRIRARFCFEEGEAYEAIDAVVRELRTPPIRKPGGYIASKDLPESGPSKPGARRHG
jgi:hypothetical protein